MSQADLRELLDAGGQRGRAEERLSAVSLNRFQNRFCFRIRIGSGLGIGFRFLLLVQRVQDGADVAFVAELEGPVGLDETNFEILYLRFI